VSFILCSFYKKGLFWRLLASEPLQELNAITLSVKAQQTMQMHRNAAWDDQYIVISLT
jgi:hypothetical protein